MLKPATPLVRRESVRSLLCVSAPVTDEIERQWKLVAKAGDNTRVMGSTKQPVSMPEIGDLRANQTLLLQLLKALNPADENTLTRSDFGRTGAAARWSK